MVARLIHRHAVADRYFAGAQPGTIADVDDGDAAIFGIDPVAAGAIRDATGPSTGEARKVTRMIDLGDIRLPATLGPVVQTIAKLGARAVMLGGGAEECAAFIDGFTTGSGGTQTSVILLSPRFDVVLPQAPWTDGRALAIGAQRLISKARHSAWRQAGGVIVAAAAVEAGDADRALNDLADLNRATLLLVDLSVVDTGYAAGAAFRNVGGLSPAAVFQIVERAVSMFDIRGLALFNLAPERDPRGHSERIAASIAQSFLGRSPLSFAT